VSGPHTDRVPVNHVTKEDYFVTVPLIEYILAELKKAYAISGQVKIGYH
jgi:hypothetical protein